MKLFAVTNNVTGQKVYVRLGETGFYPAPMGEDAQWVGQWNKTVALQGADVTASALGASMFGWDAPIADAAKAYGERRYDVNQAPAADAKPYVGMPATYRIGSDQYGGSIIAVSRTAHRVTWQRTGNVGMTKECTRRESGQYLAIGSKHGSLKLGIASTILDEGF